MLTLLTHSMMMFYFIGKGKAVREAVSEGNLSLDFVAEISRARTPVFSIGTLAMMVSRAAAVGGGQVLIAGGKTDCGNVNDVWGLDLAAGTWNVLRAPTDGESCIRSGRTDCTTLCF